MPDKRAIDRKRDSAFTAIVGTADDESPITAMIEVSGKLLLVKAGGIYRFISADDIDPERTNIAIQHAHQRVIPYGSDTDFVGKVFLTAHALLIKGFVSQSIDAKAGLACALDIVKEIAAMHDVERDVVAAQDGAISRLEENQRHPETLTMPAVGNLEPKVKAFLQNAVHALEFLRDLARVFFPQCPKKGLFEPIRDAVVEKFGAEDMFAKFLGDLITFNQYIRDARNCGVHPKPTERLVISDFTLRPEGVILPPSIEVIHPMSPQPPTAIANYMTQAREHIADLAELLLALLCGHHTEAPASYPILVLEIPENARQFKHQRFGYGVPAEDGRVPASGNR